MARLFIGRKKSGGGGAVKVMKNNADDPNTTPSTAVDKFLFDSEVEDLGYAVATYQIGGNINGFYPAGTGKNTCIAEIRSGGGPSVYDKYTLFFPEALLPGYGYPLYTDVQCKHPSSGRWGFNGWGGGYNENRNWGQYFFGGFGTADMAGSSAWSWDGYNRDKIEIAQSNDANVVPGIQADYRFLVWKFPLDDTPFDPPDATPVSGQRNVLIDPAVVKISRPGFDVATATGRELIADSDHIPAKVLKAGSIAQISSGGFVDVPIGFTVPPNTFVDAQFSDMDIADFLLPGYSVKDGSWDKRIVRGEYEIVNGDTVRFWNVSDFAVKARYVVFGCGDGPSAGNCPVLRRVAGSPDYVQLVRPGAADPPHWDDILVDTRVSYLPLLASGYVAKASFVASDNASYGQRMYQLAVNCPAGYVPYVKALQYQNYGSGGQTYIRWSPPTFKLLWNGVVLGQKAAGISHRMIRINGSVVTFYAMDEGQTSFNEDDNSQSVFWNGWAYHIFAVPDVF